MSSVVSSAAAVHRATGIGLIAVLCWSSTIGLMRSVAEDLGALGGAAVLYSVSAVLVLAVQGLPSRAQWRTASPVYLWGCGALFVLYEVCLSVSIGWADSRRQSLELGLINHLWPCLTIVLAVLLRQQPARWWLWAGVSLCLWGLVMVVAEETGQSLPWWQSMLANMASNPLAYAMAFAAALMWPVYSLLSRMHGRGTNGVGVFMLLSATVLWLQWAWQDTPAMQWSGSIAAQVLAIGVCTALGYSCWEHGVQHGNLAVLAAGSYFVPVLSALWGSVWLAVQPGLSFWQGAVLITVGSLVCWSATRSRR